MPNCFSKSLRTSSKTLNTFTWASVARFEPVAVEPTPAPVAVIAVPDAVDVAAACGIVGETGCPAELVLLPS